MNLQAELFTSLLRFPPPIRRTVARGAYDLVSLGYRATLRPGDGSPDAEARLAESAFMNYGYLDADEAPLELPERLEIVRHQIGLYRHVLAGVELAGRDVVEVGCGRGGGAAWIAEFGRPATTVGIDLSPGAIAFCRRQHSAAGLSFLSGRAESLPLGAASADVVVNVESSHCYDMDAFLREAHGVLRPGGVLCWADTRPRRDRPALERSFARSELVVRERRDITAQVLAALQAVSGRRCEVAEGSFPYGARYLVKTMLGVADTPLFSAYEHGDLQYHSATLSKRGNEPR